MKTLTQIVLPIVSLMALIGGVTFVSQFNWNPPAPSTGVPRPTAPLSFFAPGGNVEFPEETSATELELKQHGHLDFGMHNPSPSAAGVRLLSRSPSCTGVEVGIGTAAEWHHYQKGIAAAHAWPTSALGNGIGALTDVATAARWVRGLNWQALVIGKETTVPGSAEGEPAVGLVRLRWRREIAGPERLGVELSVRSLPAGPAVPCRLETPVLFLSAIGVEPATIPVGEWRSGSSPRRAQFWCWSATRPQFAIRLAQPNPHVEATFTPLSTDECQALSRKLSDPARPIQVRSAVRVAITLHEQPPGAEPFDLGPLREPVVLATDVDPEPIRVPLAGVLRGDVSVGRPEDRDQVDLGSFRADRGTDRAISLTVEQPGVKLAVDGCTPEYLTARLEPGPVSGGGQRWRLTISVAPNRAAGLLPADSAVYLRVQGDTQRRLCIPVRGQAFR